MKGNPEFMGQPGAFWALVRTLSEKLGYTNRTARGKPKGSGLPKVHSAEKQALALKSLGLNPELVFKGKMATPLGSLLERYFAYRAEALIHSVEPNLMTKDSARELFDAHYLRLHPIPGQKPICPIPKNKQGDSKKVSAYFTGLINMLMKEALGKLPCDFNPMQLTTFTRDGIPLRTLSRRVDGAFPMPVNPIGVWEVKEYYFTTTFGSRVADGVYETMLDGLELDELNQSEGMRADHVLFIDSHYTWWICGKSYLCRMIDMLNMGLVTEIVFGREILARVPELANEWALSYQRRNPI